MDGEEPQNKSSGKWWQNPAMIIAIGTAFGTTLTALAALIAAVTGNGPV